MRITLERAGLKFENLGLEAVSTKKVKDKGSTNLFPVATPFTSWNG